MKVVLDPNVIVSGLLSAHGVPARVLTLWADGVYEMVVSDLLIEELRRVLMYPKIADRIETDQSRRLLNALVEECTTTPDPDAPPSVLSQDPNDNYLIALAEHTRSVLVSGDSDLLDLAGIIPVYSPREFLALLPPNA